MKNYLVIGASSGIGKKLAERLKTEGHHVIGTYHSTEPENNGVEFHALNVMDDELTLDFVPDELHGLAYCPGSINLKPFHRIKAEEFMNDYALQTIGAIKVLQAALPKLKAADQASVVLFSTVAVQHGFNFHSQVAASKGAIEGLMRSLSAEWAPKIRVNCVAPSLTDTPLASQLLSSDDKRETNAQRHPLKRIGSPQDMAEAAAFLLTDRSAWMTGQVLSIDGGMSVIR